MLLLAVALAPARARAHEPDASDPPPAPSAAAPPPSSPPPVSAPRPEPHARAVRLVPDSDGDGRLDDVDPCPEDDDDDCAAAAPYGAPSPPSSRLGKAGRITLGIGLCAGVGGGLLIVLGQPGGSRVAADDSMIAGGVILSVIGGTSIAVGIPLVVVASKQASSGAGLAPRALEVALSVGPTRAAAVGAF